MLEIDQFTADIEAMIARWDEMGRQRKIEEAALMEQLKEAVKTTEQAVESIRAVRKSLTADAEIEFGQCERSRSWGYDPTGENAQACGAGGRYYPELEMFLCDFCMSEVGRA